MIRCDLFSQLWINSHRDTACDVMWSHTEHAPHEEGRARIIKRQRRTWRQCPQSWKKSSEKNNRESIRSYIKQSQNNHKTITKTSIQSQTIATLDVSRELAYLSTASDVSRLNFRVRNESGCDPAAMAAIEDFFTGTANLHKKYHTRYNITDFVWILTELYQLLNYRTLVSVDWTRRCLRAYIPDLSSGSFTRVLWRNLVLG